MNERIMYVCSECADNNPEGCGHYDRNDLRAMPDGRWLCESAALALGNGAVEAWQPIETAPKDGTRMLVTVLGRPQNTYVSRWRQDQWQAAPLGVFTVHRS